MVSDCVELRRVRARCPLTAPLPGRQVGWPSGSGEPARPDGATGLFARQYGEEPGPPGTRPAGSTSSASTPTTTTASCCRSRSAPGWRSRPARHGRRAARVVPAAGRQALTRAARRAGAGAVTGWAAYPLGVAWALRAAGYRVGGAASPSTPTCRWAPGCPPRPRWNAPSAWPWPSLHGLAVTRPELARAGQPGRERVRRRPDRDHGPVGRAALPGRARAAARLPQRRPQDVPLDPGAAGLALLVIDTGRRHAAERRAVRRRGRRSCEAAARALGVPSLRDVTGAAGAVARLAEPGAAAPGPARRHREPPGPGRGRAAAPGRRWPPSAPLLTASHASLRDDFEVSWPAGGHGGRGRHRGRRLRRADDRRRVRRLGRRAGPGGASGRASGPR